MISAVICMSFRRWHLVIICHVFMHFLGSFLLQDMFFSLQVFPFAGQNMKFTIKVLLTCILYCDTGPGCDYRTVCKYRRLILFTDIVFVFVSFFLRRHRSLEKATRFSRRILMFLAAIWSSSCFSSSMYRFIPPFGRSGTKCSCLRASLLTVLRVVFATVRPSSGKTIVSILHVDLISCRYF